MLCCYKTLIWTTRRTYHDRITYMQDFMLCSILHVDININSHTIYNK